MNEDDTFTALKKPTFNEMKALYIESINAGSDMTRGMIGDFFKSHGWTIEEYNRGYYNTYYHTTVF